MMQVKKPIPIYDARGNVIKTLVPEKRNVIFSDAYAYTLGQPSFTNWTVSHSVSEGMKASVWPYRSINIIASAAQQASFIVVDDAGEPVLDHPLTKLLRRPNPQISAKRILKLLVMWQLLAAEAYLFISTEGGNLSLWPVNPDRIRPVGSATNDVIIKGYAERNSDTGSTKIEYEPHEIVAFVLPDPANPITGLGPTQAAARVIDTEVEQTKFNKAAMENRGVLDGFISFKSELEQDQIDAIEERIKEKYGGHINARKIGLLGSDATYIRVASTPAEMDFNESRKSLRDETLAAYGVPSQLANAQEASTYDNFRVSELILWNSTVLPLLGDMADTLTFALQDSSIPDKYRLGDDERIAADTSKVKALQSNITEKSIAASNLAKIGFPLNQINNILELGFSQFDGWDKPFVGRDVMINPASGGGVKPTSTDTSTSDRSAVRLREIRSLDTEAENREALAQDLASKVLAPYLARQGAAVAKVLTAEGSTPFDIHTKLIEGRDELDTILEGMYIAGGISAAGDVVVQTRQDAKLDAMLKAALVSEAVILRERSLIEQSTIKLVLDQVQNGINQGLSIDAIQQSIDDVGAFGATRALRISRTVVGAASSLGQLAAGKAAGATVKVWNSARLHTRDLHLDRDGEEAPIDGRFVNYPGANGVAPRYPLDPELDAADRINCRCSLSFKL